MSVGWGTCHDSYRIDRQCDDTGTCTEVANDASCIIKSKIFPIHFLFRPSENMLIRVNNDGTYCANWTPGAIGLYTVHVTIDGIEIGKYSVK